MADDISVQLEGAVESLGRFRDSLEENNIRMGNSASIEAKINKLEAEKAAILEKGNKAETKRMKNLASGMGKAAKSMGSLAMKLGIVGGILTMFKGVLDILLKVDRHGAMFAKQMGMTRKATEGLFYQVRNVEGSFTAIGLSLGDALKTAGALAQEFGQISRVTTEMVVKTGQFAEAFGIGTQEAAQLTEHLTRAGKGMEFIEIGLKKAYISGNALGVVARDLTKNAGMVELYLSRGDDSILDMANRAASLGKSLESFGKMSEAWSDVETIGENIGKTAQLLGPAFEDGLGDLTELYRMYQNFQDDDLHQKITEQLAKTMVLEDGILKVRTRQADGTMKNMALTRAQVEQAAKLYGGDTEFMLRSVKYEKEWQKFQSAKIGQTEKLGDMTKDEFGALQDAAREIAKEKDEHDKLIHGFKEGADLLTVHKDKQKELLELAQERLALRREEADQEADIEKILNDAMGVFKKIMSMVNTIMEPVKTAISSIFDEAFMEDFNTTLEGWGKTIKGIFSAEDGGAFDLKAVADEINKPEGGITSAFSMLGDQIATGFAAGFDIKTKDNEVITSWKQLMTKGWNTLKTWLEASEKWLTAFISRILQMAWDNLDMTKGAKDWVSGATAPRERGDTGYEGSIRQKWSEWFGDDEPTGTGFGAGGVADVAGRQTSELGELVWDEAQQKFVRQSAKGWAGGAHRGIVGEAGTEVGITKSALRELSSAGIPGYYNGTSIVGSLTTDRAGLSQVAGGVGGRMGRHESSRGEQQRYTMALNNFLRRQDDFLGRQEGITQKQHEIWMRDQKEFFVRYPAVIDEAFGEPFRRGGDVVEGIYNSVFSGMQASTRAELAGADKDTQRQLMYQHMTAEGLKPGGIIDQGLGYINKHQVQLSKTFGEGFEIEQEKADELHKASVKSMNEWRMSLTSGDDKKIAELKNIALLAQKELDTQNKQVDELKELQKRGEGWNRATVGLLGGIQSGLSAAAGVIAAGGSGKQAKEMAKRGAVGGILGNIAQQLGGGDQGFLDQMNTMGVLMGTMPMPSNIGGNAGNIISKAMGMTEATFQGQGKGLGWSGNAQGRVYTSPHLAMVGEGSQNEVIIPTERIRKGLPINAGVAKELGSIGVPGYGLGDIFSSIAGGFQSGQAAQKGELIPGMKVGAQDLMGMAGKEGGMAGAGMRMSGALGKFGGVGGAVATGLMGAAQTYMATGDIGAAAGQGLGAGIGIGATVALSAIPGVGPIIGPILGPMIGSWAGGKLSKMFAKKPKYKRYRNRAIKALEEHVSSNGRFRWGQPEGAEENLIKAISGKQKDKPSEKHYEKLKKGILNNAVLGKRLRGGNVDSFIGLLSGQIPDTAQGNQMYKGFNNLFYGTPMAEGGIVTGPTSAVIGEKGPEAVIPLDRYGGYPSQQQQQNSVDMVTELKKQNQQMQLFMKKIGDAKTVLNVDGRRLAEAVGENMYDMNVGI